MSMLGEQIKELHEMADAMHRRSREIGLDYGMGRGLDDVSRMLREAADTIWQLRDDLQRENAENAKLRELVRGLLWCNGNPWNNGACDDCPISAKGAGRCDRIMRELGIEVEG